MEIKQVAIPTIYRNVVNVFITKGDTLTVVDAGFKSEEGKAQMEAALREWGYTLADVEQVLLTHHHPDHCGLVDLFERADVIGHAYCNHFLQPTEAFISYYEAYHIQLLQQHGIFGAEQMLRDFLASDMPHFGAKPVTTPLQHLQDVPGMLGFVAHYTPGHSQSHFVYVNEESGVSFGGDLILDTITPNPFIEPPLDLSFRRDSSLLRYHESLAHVNTLHIDTLYTGHGQPIQDVAARIKGIRKQQHERAMKLLHFFKAHETYSAPQLAKLLFGPVFEKQPALTLSETIGQLDYLVHQQHIKQHNEQQIYYTLIG
ncbi:MBL fold metallo-hydrolase [Caryophanon latum]|uniref:Metallo-beta-lactamase domain-containing protein n=1 Tax=Caryophanon latum TaxID=33977 RepID=A0A1C0YTC6_9BACL|nr:MBL fold metallo-hydrolase [Caryophanon latum]OCS90417.1 hypothetical protein A6K76_11165 [Caryophanon latum]